MSSFTAHASVEPLYNRSLPQAYPPFTRHFQKMLRRYGNSASSARSLRRLYSNSSGSTSKRPAAAMLGGTLFLVSAAVLGVHNLRPLMIHNDAVPSGDLADKTKTLQEASRIPKVDEIDGKLRLLAWGSNK